MKEEELDIIQKLIVKKLMQYNSEKVIDIGSYDFSVILSAINTIFINLHEKVKEKSHE